MSSSIEIGDRNYVNTIYQYTYGVVKAGEELYAAGECTVLFERGRNLVRWHLVNGYQTRTDG